MPEIWITIYSAAGVLFFEASRGYRALMSGLQIIPDGRIIPYVSFIALFLIVTTVCSNLFAGTSEIAAFLFGYGIPNGMHWAVPTDRRPQSKASKRTSDAELDVEHSVDDTFKDDIDELDGRTVTKSDVTTTSWLRKYFQAG